MEGTGNSVQMSFGGVVRRKAVLERVRARKEEATVALAVGCMISLVWIPSYGTSGCDVGGKIFDICHLRFCKLILRCI